MATQRRIRKPMPLKGRRSSWPADSIGEEYSPNVVNIRFQFGEARPGPGHGLFDRGPAFGEDSLYIGQFSKSDDIVWATMLTNSKLFRRGITTPGDANVWAEVLGTFLPSGTSRWSVAFGEDKMFFCRGGDNIAYWDGNAVNNFDLIQNVTGFEGVNGLTAGISGKFLEYFNNRLIAGYVIEGGATKANRIRWPQNADFRKWDETQFLGAGFLDLNREGSEAINGMKALGDKLVVYKRHSISEISATGTLAPVHREEVRATNIGCGAPYTIAATGFAHFFLANDMNVWSWNGSSLNPIGDPIWEEIKSIAQLDAFERYFGFVAPLRYEYWLVLSDPVRGSFDVFVYDYLRQYWTRDTFTDITSAGEVEITLSSLTWNTIPGIWSEHAESWNDLLGGRRSTLIAGRTDGATVQIDEQFTYDYYTLGSIVDRFLETEDMYMDSPWLLTRIFRLLLIYEFVNDVPFEVGVSFDRGTSWTTQQVIPTTQGYTFVDFNMTGNVYRFRFRENSANAQFRWRSYMYEYLDEGDFIGTITA